MAFAVHLHGRDQAAIAELCQQLSQAFVPSHSRVFDYGSAAYVAGMNAGRVWGYHRGELVGGVDERELDFPWIRGRFRAEPAFQPLRLIFVEWIEAVNSGDGEVMRRAHEAVCPAVTMTDPAGERCRGSSWSSKVDEACFWWRDEPAGER